MHRAEYGNQQISPWDNRFRNSLLGKEGIWNALKRAHPKSTLRSLFLAVLYAAMLAVLAGICDFLYVGLRH